MSEAPDNRIRVMLVDDSAIVRGLMQRALNDAPEIQVVATAMDGAMAIDMLKRHAVDVVILDIEMPVMDGLTALPELLKLSPKLKVIMSSTLTLRNADISMRALELGATDYLPKPSSKPEEVKEFYREMISKIRALAPEKVKAFAVAAPVPPPLGSGAAAAPSLSPPRASDRVLTASNSGVTPVAAVNTISEALNNVPRAAAIAIASSTGGPQALLTVFGALKGRVLNVPVFITQHMPPNFTTILADHLSKAFGGDCHEAKNNEEVRAGVVYVAPGDYHMTIVRDGTTVRLKLDQNPPENFCRPAADPMLRSLAAVYGNKLVGVVLTGMGADGARGAAEVVKAGGTIAVQDEATCVVYGMPKAVADAKLARAILPLGQVASYIAKAVGV